MPRFPRRREVYTPLPPSPAPVMQPGFMTSPAPIPIPGIDHWQRPLDIWPSSSSRPPSPRTVTIRPEDYGRPTQQIGPYEDPAGITLTTKRVAPRWRGRWQLPESQQSEGHAARYKKYVAAHGSQAPTYTPPRGAVTPGLSPGYSPTSYSQMRGLSVAETGTAIERGGSMPVTGPAPVTEPIMVHPNYRQHVSYTPIMDSGMFGLGATKEEQIAAGGPFAWFNKGIKMMVEGTKLVTDQYIATGTGNASGMRADAEINLDDVPTLPLSSAQKNELTILLNDIIREGLSSKRLPFAVDNVRRLTEAAVRITGYDGPMGGTELHNYYIKLMGEVVSGIKTQIVPKLEMLGKEAESRGWFSGLAETVYATTTGKVFKRSMLGVEKEFVQLVNKLQPIPMDFPGYKRVFGVVQMAQDEYMRVQENVMALPGLLTTMMTLAEYGQAVVDGIRDAIPHLGAALKFLPYVALGLGALIVYQYATAPKRLAGA